ncbi:class I SAM-dependent methyltransferase [Mycobacterium uberis]|uniref:class I SAM-dependent methyltransferase n=1 Tax=Mycobacterium uberis TaxID=2162698 RepID=UPI001FB29AE9|nr:class I SAM-dependent methyltransferase [Mycobacterium uberis]
MPYVKVFCCVVGSVAVDVLDGKEPDHPLKTSDFGEYFINLQGAHPSTSMSTFGELSVSADVRQVIVLAAGLDSLTCRLAWYNATAIFELA